MGRGSVNMTVSAVNPTQIPGSARPKKFLQALKGFLLSPRWLFLFVALSLWQTYAVYRASRLIPTPVKVGATMWKILTSGIFFEQLAASMTRILIGFSLALLVGIIIGIAMGSRKSWDEFFKALVILGLALPGLIYALICVMFFGISMLAPVTAILAGSYPFVVVNVAEGVKALDKDLIDMSRSYGVSRGKIVRQVILPSLLPFILAAIRNGFAIAWKICTLVEVFGAVSGVGYMIKNSFDQYAVYGIIAWALMFGFVMLIIEYGLLVPAERYLARWRPQVKQVI
jgi:NitT/TauT family transport system permease protein